MNTSNKVTLHVSITLLVFVGGFLTCWFFFVRKEIVTDVVTKVEYIYVEKNSEEITDKPIAEVFMNRNDVDVINKLNTPYYGEIRLKTTLSRRLLSYNNKVKVNVLYLINTKTPLLGLEYNHKKWSFSAYGGYSFGIASWDAGVEVGYTFFEW